jgi:hypothetical protein
MVGLDNSGESGGARAKRWLGRKKADSNPVEVADEQDRTHEGAH